MGSKEVALSGISLPLGKATDQAGSDFPATQAAQGTGALKNTNLAWGSLTAALLPAPPPLRPPHLNSSISWAGTAGITNSIKSPYIPGSLITLSEGPSNHYQQVIVASPKLSCGPAPRLIWSSSLIPASLDRQFASTPNISAISNFLKSHSQVSRRHLAKDGTSD
jgi:hypothetical protein